MSGILVVVEHRKHDIADVSLEMLAKGRQLAEQWGGELLALLVGKDINRYAQEIAAWADKVLAVKDDNSQGSLAEPYQKASSFIIKERKPKLVLIGHSSFGMDLAPALAVELGAPLATDCTDVSLENGSIIVRRSIYNGKVDAIYSFAPLETIVVTGRPGQFAIEAGHTKGDIEEISFPLKEEIDYKRFQGYIEPEVAEVDITKSGILVSVGRGIKDKENIGMAEELARVLGGDLSGSRPIVDYGWLPSDRQVGLSGKIVKPQLYLALGISGAFQHLVGMKGAETIIAINKDPNAPIFAAAHYGIIDDIFKVVPALTQRISESRRES